MTTNFPGAVDTYTTKVDLVDNVMAAHVNDLQDAIVALEQAALARRETETLTGNKVLVDADASIQYFDPGGAARDIELPAEGTGNHPYILVNAVSGASTSLSFCFVGLYNAGVDVYFVAYHEAGVNLDVTAAYQVTFLGEL